MTTVTMSMLDLPILECLDDCWEPVTEAQIAKLSHDLGVRLPEDFQQFLSKYNAGCWGYRVVFDPPNPADEWDVITLGLGLGIVPEDERELQDIWQMWSDLLDRYPEDICDTDIPIIHTLGGIVHIDCSAERFGQIIERSYSFNEKGELAIRYLAESFSDFMNGLRREEKHQLETLPVFMAVERGERQVLQQYLQSGGDPEQRNEYSWTLLMSAARWCWPRLVRMLLDAGADPNAYDADGLLPMHHAIAGGSMDSVKLLLGAGVRLNHRDEQGRNWARFAEEKYQHRIQRFFDNLLD